MRRVMCDETSDEVSSSLIAHRSSLIAHHSSLIAHRSSLVTHHSSLVTHHSSLITHRSSLITLSIVIIAQVVDDRAPEYERKSQRADFAALRERHDVRFGGDADGAQVKHVYASRSYIAQTKRFFAKKEFVTPFNLPECVEDHYFLDPRSSALGTSTIGSFSRKSVTQLIEQTMARIHRVRDDVTWHVFDHAPSPQEIASVDVWVDPAVQEDDYDGFVAEAMAANVMVVVLL